MKIHRLTFVKDSEERRHGLRMGVFQCDCGQKITVRVSRVMNGYTKSCGCLRGRVPRHGMWGTSEYNIWQSMLQRCENPTRKDFPRYGGRGITVCDEWQNFEAFYAYVGPRPDGMTLDRIDGERGYEPGNVRWATAKQQAANRRQRT